MRSGLLRTAEFLDNALAVGIIRPYREADRSTRMCYQDMHPDHGLWQDPEQEDGWHVTYMQAPIEDDAGDMVWFAECINDEGDAKGFMTDKRGTWTPTHGDHAEWEAEQEAAAPVAVPGTCFAGGGQPVLAFTLDAMPAPTLADIKTLQVAIAKADDAYAVAQPGLGRMDLMAAKMRLLETLNEMVAKWLAGQGL